jgi:hypothetical protein
MTYKGFLFVILQDKMAIVTFFVTRKSCGAGDRKNAMEKTLAGPDSLKSRLKQRFGLPG